MNDVTKIVPAGDAGLDAYVETLMGTLRASPERFGVDASRLERLESLTSAWKTSYDEVVQTRQLLRESLAVKNDAGSAIRTAASDLLRRIRYDDALTDADRRAVGLSGRFSVPRTYEDPSTPPQLRIVAGGQSKHVLEAFDDDAINRRVRPEGVVAAEVYRRIDGDVHDFDGYEPVATMSRRRTTIRYAATDHGRVAHYRARWITRDGRVSDYSDPVSRTVTKF